MADHAFGAVDYVLFALTLVASAAIGTFFSIKGMLNKKDSPDDVLLGGGHMPVIPTALSLLTSFLSGVSLLGIPAEIYKRGTPFWISRVVGTPIAVIVAMLFVLPVLWEFKPTSVYIYLERRFNSVILRYCGTVLYLVFMASYMAIVLYAPAFALSGITKVPAWVFFISVGVLCNLYTSFGGLKAVVWTDTLQCFFMLFGLMAMFFKGVVDTGGFRETFRIASEGERFAGLSDFDPNPFQYMTMWTSIFGGIGFWFTLLTFNQISVQRYLSLDTLKKSQTVLGINIPGYIIFCTLADLMGVVMYSYYFKRGCDPVSAGIVAQDQLVINYSLDVLGVFPGLPGIFLACLFSGTLSTISSGINSMAAVTWEDFFKPRYGNVSSKKQANIVKVIGLAYGFLAIGLSFGAGPLGGILKACLSVMGAIGGPLVGLFLLGLFVPFANKIGAFAGLAVSVVLTFAIAVGNAVLKPYKPYGLPVRVDNCTNVTAAYKSMTHDPHNPLTGYQFIFGLSPVFYASFGILFLLLVSIPTSLLFKDSQLDPEVIRPLTVVGYYSNLLNKSKHKVSPGKAKEAAASGFAPRNGKAYNESHEKQTNF